MSKTYLVTGAAGFIGSNVAKQLCVQGHTVYGLDNFSSLFTYPVDIKWRRWHELQGHKEFVPLRGDINHLDDIEDVFERAEYDAVLHFAAIAGVRQSIKSPASYFQTNVMGTINVLDACMKYGVPKALLTSSSSVYGNHPIIFGTNKGKAADGWMESLSWASRPLSPYAASKKAMEVLAHPYYHLHGLDILIPRYFTVYGLGRPDMSILKFVHHIYEGVPITVYGNGEQKRDFTHIQDVVSGTIAMLEETEYRVMNLGYGEPESLNRIIELIEAVTHRKAEVRYEPAALGDVPVTWANNDRARLILGWQPQIDIAQGIQMECEAYERNRKWLKELIPK